MDRGSGDARGSIGDGTHDWKATRRRVLATSGAVALGGLAGCSALDGLVDRASDQIVQNRTASPAGFYTGSETLDTSGGLYRSGPVDVRFIPPTLEAEGQRIEIDGWSTSSTTRAQDYNSSRSNRPRTIWVPDPHDVDDDGDGIPELVAALDAERALVVYASAALAAVDDRASDGINDPFDGFTKVSEIRSVLDRCRTDICRTVAKNLATQVELVGDARDAVAAGEWDSASQSLRRARRIAQNDIDDILAVLDSDGASHRFDNLEIRGRRATIGERFAVSLPNARVRGDRTTPSLYQELTPKRVLEYFLGEHDAEGCAESGEGVSIHRDLACRDLLTSTLGLDDGVDLAAPRGIDKTDVRRGVAVFDTSGGVIVTGATPAAAVAEPMLRVSADGAVVPEDLDGWGEETTIGEADVTPTLVVPVGATPPDSPAPMPALFYVRRIVHDDQLLFVGGWHIDAGALYQDSATLLTADGPNVVVGVTRSDIDEGGVDLDSHIEGRKRPGRTKWGNVTLKRTYDPNDDALPAGAQPACRDDGEVYCWDVQSAEAVARHDTGNCPYTDSAPTAVVTALDAPVLHLVDAEEASNDVQFKAGAELSKAVN
ncbi:MAG: hypothetical protein ABEJ74_00895 [Haloferacaceae archaeon]